MCEPVGDGFRARFAIRARGKVAVEGTAELVTYENFAARDRATGVARANSSPLPTHVRSGARRRGQGATASGVRKPVGR